MVRGVGLEPTSLAAQASKTCVYAIPPAPRNDEILSALRGDDSSQSRARQPAVGYCAGENPNFACDFLCQTSVWLGELTKTVDERIGIQGEEYG
jgi:hypothetical protein